MTEDICAPLLVAVDDYFGVRIGSELMTFPLQLGSDFLVVINFAVERYPNAFFCVRHWLMTARKIDD
jgi:hypothetical protein